MLAGHRVLFYTAAIMTTQVEAILLDPQIALNAGKVEINIRVSADMNVSAFAARQQITGFVCDQISYLMGAGDPSLVISDKLYWRVPIIFTLPGQGNLGEVGHIDVNVENGQLMVTNQLIEGIKNRAEAVALRSTP